MPFEFKRLDIPDVVLVTPRVFEDERGFFKETYQRAAFAKAGIPHAFVQDNHSRSVGRVLRGLHFQNPPHAQGKLVSVPRGEVFDVAVDIRQGSPSYGQWVAEVLSEENHRMLYVPEGFAHGFCVLSEEAVVTYKVTAQYAPECDSGVIWNDPEIHIDWPIDAPLLSEKDAMLPPLRQVELGFVYEPAPVSL